MENLKNAIFEMSIIPQTLSINSLRTASTNSINQHTIRWLIKCSLKKVLVMPLFTPTIFEKFLLEYRLVLPPAKLDTGKERIKFSKKNQKNIQILLKILEKWSTYKFRRFWMVVNIIIIIIIIFIITIITIIIIIIAWFCLTLSVPEKF